MEVEAVGFVKEDRFLQLLALWIEIAVSEEVCSSAGSANEADDRYLARCQGQDRNCVSRVRKKMEGAEVPLEDLVATGVDSPGVVWAEEGAVVGGSTSLGAVRDRTLWQMGSESRRRVVADTDFDAMKKTGRHEWHCLA